MKAKTDENVKIDIKEKTVPADEDAGARGLLESSTKAN